MGNFKNININEKIQNLYINKKYYYKLNPRKLKTNNYWKVSIDPEGKKRLRTSKKEFINFNFNQKYLVDFINNQKPLKLLDIGCGIGYLLSNISDKHKKFGMEIDKSTYEIASRFAEISIGELKKINYQENFFDLIVCHHVIEHVAKPEFMIREIKRILKNKGILAIGTPDFDSAAARRYKNKYRLLDDPTHISLFSNDSMHRFLRDNNFDIFRTEYPYFDTKYFSKKNLIAMKNKNTISPPFYGNFMTFFCKNKK